MKAVLVKPLKNGIKTISGAAISRGIGVIALLVADKKGGTSIKRFKKTDYIVTCYEE